MERLLFWSWLRRLAATTLLIPAFSVHAQERVAQDDKSLPATYQDLIRKVPVSCVKEVMDEAAKRCPAGECQVPVPNSELPVADSCDARTWVCVWPTQKVGETVTCPASWTGTYSQDRLYELRHCGRDVVPTNDVTVLSVNCTRQRAETRGEECPAIDGGGWTGAGVVYRRHIDERLGSDLTTAEAVTTGDWQLVSVDCRRTVTRNSYLACPVLGMPVNEAQACHIRTTDSGVVVVDSCGDNIPPSPRRFWTRVFSERLGSDLAVIEDSASTATIHENSCPGVVVGGDGVGDGTVYGYGDGPGDGAGDGDCGGDAGDAGGSGDGDGSGDGAGDGGDAGY